MGLSAPGGESMAIREAKIRSLFLYDYACVSESTSMEEAHFHNVYEIGYLITGWRNMFIGDRLYRLQAGDLTLIPVGVPHKATVLTAGRLKRIVINVAKEWVPPSVARCFDHTCYHIPAESMPGLRDILRRMEEEYAHPQDIHRAVLLRGLVYELLAFLQRLVDKDASVVNDEQDGWAEKVTRYIGEHYAEPLTLQVMAQEFVTSREYFSMRFKKSTGFGFSEYLTQVRMANAIYLLEHPGASVTDVAYQCGFNDSSYFAAVFKSVYGITPKKYQQNRTEEY